MKSLLAGVIVASVYLFCLPRGYWEPEEVSFAHALVTFDPLQHRPAPPVHPLFIGLARLVYAFVHEPLAALLALSVLASAAGAALFARGAGKLLDDEWSGVAASLFLWLSPAMLVFAPLPGPDAVAMACLAAALWLGATGRALGSGIALGAAVGAQPFWIGGAVAWAIAGMKKDAGQAAGAPRVIAGLAAGMAMSFLPVVEAIGIGRLDDYVRYAKTSLAATTGGELSGAALVVRFVAHPWGTKWLAAPILLAAVAGLAVLVRERRWRLLPLLAFAAVQLAVALLVLDRGDGVQPVLATLGAPAVLAALALRRVRRPLLFLAIPFAVASLVYVRPLIEVRRVRESAPREALAAALRSLPPSAVLTCDPPLTIYARAFAPSLQPHSTQFLDRMPLSPDAPLYLFTDGGSSTAGAMTIAWPDSDAYGKVTTERYRVASIVPLDDHRYGPGEGVHQLEEDPREGVWRWLAPRAAIDLPRSDRVEIEFGLPHDAPIAENRIEVLADGVLSGAVVVPRGGRTTIAIAPARRIEFRASASYTPPGEGRALAAQLFGVSPAPQ